MSGRPERGSRGRATGGHDAIVIGAGPAGASAALVLARGGVRVVIVEAESFPRRKVCGEYLSATNLAVFDALGLGDGFRTLAGPEIRRVALWSGTGRPEAALRPVRVMRDDGASGGGWGRALGRDVLDAWLLDAARTAGAEVLQPARAVGIASDPAAGVSVRVRTPGGERVLSAPVAISAHGSWRPGPLPAQPARSGAPGDLLGFKAHFEGVRLDPGLMPLLAFPGGYGGVVTADGGRVSLSCCIRRDRLAAVRAAAGGAPAGEAVLAHVLAASAAAAEAFAPARRIGPWLSAGPIRPGLKPVRDPTAGGALFRAGNAAAEAHPVIAEGISMAIQSGWLLASALLAAGGTGPEALDAVTRRYAAALRTGFGPRIRAAAVLAALAASPLAQRLALPLVEAAPGLIALGARASGKYRAPPAPV